MATLKITASLITGSLIEVVPTFENKVPGSIYSFDIRCVAYPGTVAGGDFDFNPTTVLEGQTALLTEDYDKFPFVAGDYVVTCESNIIEIGSGGASGLHPIVGELGVVVPGAPTCDSGVSSSAAAVTITPVDIVDGVLDVTHTRYTQFPDVISMMKGFPFPRTVVSGTQVHLKCCAGEECAFAFALYRCEACTGPKPFGMTKKLLLDNWDSASCSPKFDADFSTTLFYKNVQGPYEKTFDLQHDELFVVLMKDGSLPAPLCSKPHGPFPTGTNCGDRCPTL